MTDIQRYKVLSGVFIVEQPDGSLVDYDDHAVIVAALQEQVQKLEAAQQHIVELEYENTQLKENNFELGRECLENKAEIARRDKAAGDRVGVVEVWPGTRICDFLLSRPLPVGQHNVFTAATPAALPWNVDLCPNCGSKKHSWDTTVIKNTAVQDGLLKLNETSGLFYLGCDECSETLLRVSAEDVASYMNNAKAHGFTVEGE